MSWLRRRSKAEWLIIFGFVTLLVLGLPLVVGAVTSTDALAGLGATLEAMVKALKTTVEAMTEAYTVYLGAL